MCRAALHLAAVAVAVSLIVWTSDATSSQEPDLADQESGRLFAERIAPLLSQRCLECHGVTAKKGRLDLTGRESAMAGGESGVAVLPGNPSESRLWQLVEADEMPKGRLPLSDEEKQLLFRWISGGAIWPDALAKLTSSDGPADRGSVRRLTVAEYIETVRATMGVDIANEARRMLPPDIRADGFSNTAYNLNVDFAHVEAYSELAALIVDRMDVPAFAARFSPKQDLSDEHLRSLISTMGQWVLRGPLEADEVESFLNVARTVATEGGDYNDAVKYVLETMLQSPRFIYRIERTTENGVLSGFELASRLSYILWGASPDQELMRAAEAGELADRRLIAAQVQRMLRDPRAIDRSLQFISEWMHLDRMSTLRPNRERFTSWNDGLADDMRQETLAYFKHLAWEMNRPLSELLNAQVTFATPRLARYYGLIAGDSQTPDGLEVLYRFDEGSGNTVHDSAEVGEPIHLIIEQPENCQWTADGLVIQSPTRIASQIAATRLVESVQRTKEITIEAWVTPANETQGGPARIVSLSSSPNERNFTIGQEANKYEVRFRAANSGPNGVPGMSSPDGTARTQRSHIVFTRNAAGAAKLYINRQEVASHEFQGDLGDWSTRFSLLLGNEATGDRPWLGVLHQVAIYHRALTAEEIQSVSEPRAHSQELVRYDLSGVPGRGGLLTQGSVLSIGGEDASMVTRGLFVFRELLYDRVEDPPPCVDTRPVPSQPGQSQRAVSMQRIENASCSGCHARFEPLAFAFEKFDGLGAYREVDEFGNTLREDGEILFPESEEPIAYTTTEELLNLLAGSERVQMAITRKLVQFSIGRPLVAEDEPVVAGIHHRAQDNGGTYASLMTAIVMSELVQPTAAERHE